LNFDKTVLILTKMLRNCYFLCSFWQTKVPTLSKMCFFAKYSQNWTAFLEVETVTTL